MNKKGDTPTILLFIITLILVVIALFSFASFNGTFAGDSEGRSIMLSSVDFYEKYAIKESEIIGKEVIKNNGGKEEFQKIAKKRHLGIEGTEEFFARINSGNFKFEKDGENYIFEMKDLRVSASAGANWIKRKFDIRAEFDEKGNAVRISQKVSSFTTTDEF